VSVLVPQGRVYERVSNLVYDSKKYLLGVSNFSRDITRRRYTQYFWNRKPDLVYYNRFSRYLVYVSGSLRSGPNRGMWWVEGRSIFDAKSRSPRPITYAVSLSKPEREIVSTATKVEWTI
jgi:hypothetical protein